jgi:hypothetical protein
VSPRHGMKYGTDDECDITHVGGVDWEKWGQWVGHSLAFPCSA